MAKGIEISKYLFYGIISAGFGIILLVGLLCGLVARPNNCKPLTTTSPLPIKTTSMSSPTGPSRTTRSTTRRPPSPDTFRLPTNIEPYNYNVWFRIFFEPYVNDPISIDPEKEYYQGVVEIKLKVVEATNAIVLNSAKELNTQVSSLYDNTANKPIAVDNVNDVELRKDGIFVIKLKQSLPANTDLTLKMSFKNKINTRLFGLYKSRYQEDGIYKF